MRTLKIIKVGHMKHPVKEEEPPSLYNQLDNFLKMNSTTASELKMQEVLIGWDIAHPPLSIQSMSPDDIGKTVAYLPKRSSFIDSMKASEGGIITAYNDTYVFVRFGKGSIGSSQACNPEDLRY